MNNKNKGIKINIWLFGTLFLIFFLALIINFFILNRTNKLLDKKIVIAKEEARPADLNIVVLEAPECEDCFDVQLIIGTIKKENINLKTEKSLIFDSEESKELIKKYNITKLPTFLVTGEIEKDKNLMGMWPTLGEIRDETFIFRKNYPPYVIAETGEVKGRLNLKLITDKSCKECFDVANHPAILQRMGLPVNNQRVYEASLSDGRALIAKYNIQLLPTFVLEGDLEQYPGLTKIWAQVGSVEKDGAYILREGVKGVGIYKNIKTGEIIDPKKTQATQPQK